MEHRIYLPYKETALTSLSEQLLKFSNRKSHISPSYMGIIPQSLVPLATSTCVVIHGNHIYVPL